MKNEFISILKENVQREGLDKLLLWIEKTDFFTTPCSMKNHCAYEGGLVEHSINVYKRLYALVEKEYGGFEKYSKETVAICSLLHDVCKIDFYKIEMRNAKVDGNWVQVPYFTISDSLPYGHGEKSVYIINGFLRLSRDEALAINWHMGGFDARVKGGSYSLSDAYNRTPLCLFLHIADMQATYLDEVENS